MSSAFASQQVIDYFGTAAGEGSLGGEFVGVRAVAVNYTGAGPADPGDVYVADAEGFNGGRIQRFAYDDNGTPAEPYDDSYHFVSAWGADVVQAGGVGDQGDAAEGNFEICTVASQCKSASLVSGNGTVAGNGAMSYQDGLAVDQDTGRVYVSDGADVIFGKNARINVYEGDGTFLYSFGFDVDATEPGTGYEVCPASHVCKVGVPGNGVGQINTAVGIAISPPDGNPSAGTVFLVDRATHRIATFGLAGESPSSIGSAAEFSKGPVDVAVDSRGIVYASEGDEIVRYDSADANGGGVGFLTPISAPPLPSGSDVRGLALDPDSDGAGTDEDVLYAVVSNGGLSVVQQFGPINDPGLTAPPVAEDDHHGELVGFKSVSHLGLDPVHGRLFVSANHSNLIGNAPLNAPPDKHGVYVLGPSGGAPTVSLDAITNVTSTSATIEGTVNPNSGPPVSYSVEYSRDGVNWSETAKTLLGAQTTDQPVTAELSPLGTGLEPNTLYHVRLVATKAFQAPVVSPEQTFSTDAAAPAVETVGSPVRTATTARFEGRINPRNAATTYSFEYLDAAAYQANLSASEPPFTGAASTAPKAAGSGSLIELVAAQAEGLEPDTTYHYRLVGDNGKPGSPAQGQERTLTTRASDAPLSHGRLPGPVGSDRAYEQITMPDTGGNPVSFAMGFADDSNSALYSIAGGTPISDTGSLASIYYAERTAGGWQTKKITPPRSELFGSLLAVAGAASDLSTVLMENIQVGTAGSAAWQLVPAGAPSKLFETTGSQELALEFGSLSADGSRAMEVLFGGVIDPANPAAGTKKNLYDLSSGLPQLVSFLPGNVIASCGSSYEPRLTRWLSAEGRYAFFVSAGQGPCDVTPSQLYMRDLEAAESKLLSGPALSGNLCEADLLKATPGFVFFWTQSRLVAGDTQRASCQSVGGGDVYRYEIAGGALECVTCVVPGLDADVVGGGLDPSARRIAVADDGSRVYFTAGPSLLPGAPVGAAYRLNVESGDLAYIGKGRMGIVLTDGNAITPDGSVIVFRSNDSSLNTLGGATNGGTHQYYRYDDRDRSLVCLSCPSDGSVPFAGIPELKVPLSVGSSVGPNTSPISDDGETIAFPAPTALVNADQNTPKPGPEAGIAALDVYEWRDGRLFLITDGLTDWAPDSEPLPAGVSPSGKDIYFLAAAQYTQDALDGYMRLYDARIGGGFEFPAKPTPCPLEVCQGTPKGVPEEQEPASGTFNGPGNAAKTTGRCPKGKRLVRRAGKARCVKPTPRKAKKNRNRANHDRRAAK